MNKRAGILAAVGVASAIAATMAISCSGGGGGGGGGTRFEGNVSNGTAFLRPQSAPPRFAWLSLVGTAFAQGVSDVHVCVQQFPEVCTDTDENGSFSLSFDGDLENPCLVFSVGTDSLGTVCVSGVVANGSVVTIDDIDCEGGTCTVTDVDVEEPDGDVSQDVSDEDTPSAPDDDAGEVSTDNDISNDDDGNDDTDQDGDGIDDDQDEDGDGPVED